MSWNFINRYSKHIYEHQNPSEMHKQGRYFGIMIKLDNKISVLANVLKDQKNQEQLISQKKNMICIIQNMFNLRKIK